VINTLLGSIADALTALYGRPVGRDAALVFVVAFVLTLIVTARWKTLRSTPLASGPFSLPVLNPAGHRRGASMAASTTLMVLALLVAWAINLMPLAIAATLIADGEPLRGVIYAALGYGWIWAFLALLPIWLVVGWYEYGVWTSLVGNSLMFLLLSVPGWLMAGAHCSARMAASTSAPRMRSGRKPLTIVRIMVASLLLGGAPAAADLAEFRPLAGPATVDLGRNLAALVVDGDHYFIDADDTRRLMEALGNPATRRELGTILPKTGAEWFVVLEWEETGYVRDDDGRSLNADSLLEAVRRATDQANEQRRVGGHPALQILGWAEKPRYDAASRRLVWALVGRPEDEQWEIINYNTRVLGRRGLISVTLVTDAATFAEARSIVPGIVAGISFKPGQRYEEFVRGQDKLAEYGLATLVAGGAGVATVKAVQSGLLSRFWKAIVVAALGVAGGLLTWLTRTRKRPARA